MFGFKPRRARGTSTPTVTAGSGIFTSVNAALAFTFDGARLLFNCTINDVTNGTAATDVEFTLPFTPSANTACTGVDSSGIGLAALAKTDGKVYVTKASDGSYPGATGKTLYVEGVVRMA